MSNMSEQDIAVQDRECEACGAVAGELCRPWCIGQAAHGQQVARSVASLAVAFTLYRAGELGLWNLEFEADAAAFDLVPSLPLTEAAERIR